MLTDSITSTEISKIFGNTRNKKDYLNRLFKELNLNYKIAKDKNDIDEQIKKTWSYEISKSIIRDLFKETLKYKRQKESEAQIAKAIEEWNKLNLGEFKWPFSAKNFDQHIHMINRNNDYSETEKDEVLTNEIIKFRRIKHINSLRNDYIEYLIFKNENVIPTLGNRKAVDFYINGEPYDQKVSKSVGDTFVKEYGEQYKETAIAHPEYVAESLYKNQDEQRFGDEPRLLIVYLDNDATVNTIQSQLSGIDFNKPYEIQFNYEHSSGITTCHNTKCFVILLHG